MASLSFRDRFFSPPVARALTSPSGILATGAGAAVGIVATAPLSLPLAVGGAVLGGAIGLGARLAAALPGKGAGPRIDPFAVDEPWRGEILDAVRARARFSQAVGGFRSGPLQETLHTIGDRLDEALDQCWQVTQQGQRLSDARAEIDLRDVDRDLARATEHEPVSTRGEQVRAETVRALEAQRAAAGRMDELIERTEAELHLINARLDESVTQAIELSVSDGTSSAAPLGASVEAIVGDLEALRLAMASLEGTDPGPASTGTPAP